MQLQLCNIKPHFQTSIIEQISIEPNTITLNRNNISEQIAKLKLINNTDCCLLVCAKLNQNKIYRDLIKINPKYVAVWTESTIEIELNFAEKTTSNSIHDSMVEIIFEYYRLPKLIHFQFTTHLFDYCDRNICRKTVSIILR